MFSYQKLLPKTFGHLRLICAELIVAMQHADFYHDLDNVLDQPFGIFLAATLEFENICLKNVTCNLKLEFTYMQFGQSIYVVQ